MHLAWIYIADFSLFSLTADKYKLLYGKCKLFRYSEKRSAVLNEWSVSITHKLLKTPHVIVVYSDIDGESRYPDYLKIIGNGMMVDLVERRAGMADSTIMIFKAPAQNEISILPGGRLTRVTYRRRAGGYSPAS